MATYIPPTISPALRHAAELKKEEFDRMKAEFKARYQDNPTISAAESTPLKRVVALLGEIERLDPYLEDDDEFKTLRRYVDQAKNDRSVSEAKLAKFEKQLLDKLTLRANRMEVNSLHVELLDEVLDSTGPVPKVANILGKPALEDDFEIVESEMVLALENFTENTLFSEKVVDRDVLTQYLSSFFQEGTAGTSLAAMRKEVKEYANAVMDGQEDIDEDQVEWCVNDLLQNAVVSDEKRKTLQGYLQSPVALRELTSTINVKSIRHWKWRNALRITAYMMADGKWCISAEEDIMDTIFLHSIAIGWAHKFKGYLLDLISNFNVSHRAFLPSSEELDKREYYLEPPRPVRNSPPKPYCHTPPPAPPPPPAPIVYNLSPPPPPPPPPAWEPKSKKKTACTHSYMPRMHGFTLEEERHRMYRCNFFLSRFPEAYGSSFNTTRPEETQAKLLSTLATEAKLREGLEGEVHGLTTNFRSFASSLPHDTILTVLKFFGVPNIWLEFFTRFLKTPLKMGQARILTRSCGVPVGHAMELLFGELVLFFLDLTVYRTTRSYIYRLRDRSYFIGSRMQCDRVSHVLYDFANAFGVDLVETRMEKEVIGMVTISILEGKLTLGLDNDKVDAHAYNTKKQLAECKTVLDWVRTWNATIGTYAPHLFGAPANVFGKPHWEAVTKAYNRMHDILFPDSNLTDHVKQLLATHLHRPLRDPPLALEPLIFLPTAYGGLGVKNPYITLNLAHKILESPTAAIQKYLDSEKEYYSRAKTAFEAYKPEAHKKKLTAIFGDNKERMASAFGNQSPYAFFSFAELTKYRDIMMYPLLQSPPWPIPLPPFTPAPAIVPLYNQLMEEPMDQMNPSDRVFEDIGSLSGKGGMKRWYRLNEHDHWVLQMYADECFERYGTLEIWVGEAVPHELLKLVRGDAEVDDEDSSYASSLSEV